MAEAVQRERWNHTAMLCAVAVMCASKPGTKVDPRQFHPMELHAAGGEAIDVDAETVGVIGKMFDGLREGY